MNLRLILRIARTELAVLFYSPVAWLLLVAFTCQDRIRLYEYPDGNSKNKSIGQHDHF